MFDLSANDIFLFGGLPNNPSLGRFIHVFFKFRAITFNKKMYIPTVSIRTMRAGWVSDTSTRTFA